MRPGSRCACLFAGRSAGAGGGGVLQTGSGHEAGGTPLDDWSFASTEAAAVQSSQSSRAPKATDRLASTKTLPNFRLMAPSPAAADSPEEYAGEGVGGAGPTMRHLLQMPMFKNVPESILVGSPAASWGEERARAHTTW